jgi:hypothetical protein
MCGDVAILKISGFFSSSTILIPASSSSAFILYIEHFAYYCGFYF